MILGTYWYFDFPTDLYTFDYFEFRKGYGGHADNPAELITHIETKNPEKIISELKLLVECYDEGFLFIYRDKEQLKIGTGGHQLFDYDFLFISEVELVLKKEKALLLKGHQLDNPEFMRIYNDNNANKIIYPKKNVLTLVGSELKKHNAENSKLRLDCHLKLTRKDLFISELKASSKQENMAVFYYYEQTFDDKVNLMLFFTNGRQGLHFTKKQYVDCIRFENQVEEIMLKYNASPGHVSGHGLYPQNGPKIEMIIEEAFIL